MRIGTAAHSASFGAGFQVPRGRLRPAEAERDEDARALLRQLHGDGPRRTLALLARLSLQLFAEIFTQFGHKKFQIIAGGQ